MIGNGGKNWIKKILLCMAMWPAGFDHIVAVGSRNAQEMDTLGIEPRASRTLSGCDTTTPCAP